MGHRVTTLNVNTIEPAGNTLTIGASGDTVVLADDVKANTYKDAGGNTLFVSDGSGNLSSVNSGFGDSLKLLSTQTASNSASLSFTSGIDSTYGEYIFKFINIHPATDQWFGFQFNSPGYNQTMTTTSFSAYHKQNAGDPGVTYYTGQDLAQGTTYQYFAMGIGGGSDECGAGELHLFNPSSTTYVKHFYGTCQYYLPHSSSDYTATSFVGGYVNTTSAITAIDFKFVSGNFDGKIKMYGVA